MPDETGPDPIPARGGPFPNTRWSLVLAVGGSAATSERALETLCQAYWPAVYAYARHRGYSTEHAEDLTQGYFAKLLEKRYVEQADRERGKFRTFLLTSFKNYMANEWDRTQALKRGGRSVADVARLHRRRRWGSDRTHRSNHARNRVRPAVGAHLAGPCA